MGTWVDCVMLFIAYKRWFNYTLQLASALVRQIDSIDSTQRDYVFDIFFYW